MLASRFPDRAHRMSLHQRTNDKPRQDQRRGPSCGRGRLTRHLRSIRRTSGSRRLPWEEVKSSSVPAAEFVAFALWTATSYGASAQAIIPYSAPIGSRTSPTIMTLKPSTRSVARIDGRFVSIAIRNLHCQARAHSSGRFQISSLRQVMRELMPQAFRTQR